MYSGKIAVPPGGGGIRKKVGKMHSRCSGIMGGHGNFAFNLLVMLSVELGYVFL
jgi:hypothetical protein